MIQSIRKTISNVFFCCTSQLWVPSQRKFEVSWSGAQQLAPKISLNSDQTKQPTSKRNLNIKIFKTFQYVAGRFGFILERCNFTEWTLDSNFEAPRRRNLDIWLSYGRKYDVEVSVTSPLTQRPSLLQIISYPGRMGVTVQASFQLRLVQFHQRELKIFQSLDPIASILHLPNAYFFCLRPNANLNYSALNLSVNSISRLYIWNPSGWRRLTWYFPIPNHQSLPFESCEHSHSSQVELK